MTRISKFVFEKILNTTMRFSKSQNCPNTEWDKQQQDNVGHYKFTTNNKKSWKKSC